MTQGMSLPRGMEGEACTRPRASGEWARAHPLAAACRRRVPTHPCVATSRQGSSAGCKGSNGSVKRATAPPTCQCGGWNGVPACSTRARGEVSPGPGRSLSLLQQGFVSRCPSSPRGNSAYPLFRVPGSSHCLPTRASGCVLGACVHQPPCANPPASKVEGGTARAPSKIVFPRLPPHLASPAPRSTQQRCSGRAWGGGSGCTPCCVLGAKESHALLRRRRPAAATGARVHHGWGWRACGWPAVLKNGQPGQVGVRARSQRPSCVLRTARTPHHLLLLLPRSRPQPVLKRPHSLLLLLLHPPTLSSSIQAGQGALVPA